MITRLIYNHHHSVEDNGGFLFSTPATYDVFMAVNKDPFENYGDKVLHSPKNMDYLSHIGFQDNLLTPVSETLYRLTDWLYTSTSNDNIEKFGAFYIVRGTQLFVTILNALALSLILLWARKEFSTFTAYGALAFILIALPDLTFFGRSMWWVMFTWFLPFLTILGAYAGSKGTPLKAPILILSSALAGAFLTLKTSMGYEYTSTVMVATLVPVTYYALSRGWRFTDWLLQCFVIGLFQLFGIGLTLYLHYEALNAAGYDAIDVLGNRLEKRAYGGNHAADISDYLAKSTNASLFNVYGRHLLWHQHVGRPEILVMIPGFIWLWNRRHAWKDYFTTNAKDRALLASIVLSGLGAASMFTLLKGHSYVHSFDVVAFSIPMNILIGIFYGRQLEKKFK